jgi:peptide/nickel transport system permease protein
VSETVLVQPESAGQRFRRRYLLATLGGVLILAWLIAAILAPVVSPYDPTLVDVTTRLRPPSATRWLGADALGRDVLSRVIWGARVSLLVGFGVVLIGAAFGTLIGGVAAYVRGWAEEALMRVTDLVFCFPPIILAMAIAAALGIGTRNTMIAMLSRLVAQVRPPRPQPRHRPARAGYVGAGRCPQARAGTWRVLARQILPNAAGPLVVLVTLGVGNAILVFAGLSFLGLGVTPHRRPNGAPWSPRAANWSSRWWVATFPGLAILSVVIGLQFPRRRRHPRLARPPGAHTMRHRS